MPRHPTGQSMTKKLIIAEKPSVAADDAGPAHDTWMQDFMGGPAAARH